MEPLAFELLLLPAPHIPLARRQARGWAAPPTAAGQTLRLPLSTQLQPRAARRCCG